MKSVILPECGLLGIGDGGKPTFPKTLGIGSSIQYQEMVGWRIPKCTRAVLRGREKLHTVGYPSDGLLMNCPHWDLSGGRCVHWIRARGQIKKGQFDLVMHINARFR